MADTGQGTTSTLGTTGSVGAVRQMTLPEWLIEALEDHDLSTTGFMTFVPSDLSNPGECELEVLFDPTVSAAVPAPGTVETLTVTWPIHTSGNTTNAVLTGTGFIDRTKLPDMATGTLQTSRIRFKFDGKTGPTFTGESA